MNKFLMVILLMFSFGLLKSMEERENRDNIQKTSQDDFQKKEKSKKKNRKKNKISSIFGRLSGALGSRYLKILEDNSNLKQLPSEIKMLLIENLVADANTKDQLIQAIKDLKNLSFTNKYFYNF